jgi:tape measure domain-containing protein
MQSLAQFGQAKDTIITNLQRFQQALSQATAQGTQQMQTLTAQTQHTSQTFQQFNQQINQTNQTFQHVNQTFDQSVNTVNNLTTVINQARQGAQSFGSVWRTVLGVAGGIGLATSISGIVSALKEFAQASVETATRLESLRNSLSSLAGSVPAGQQQFQRLFETAQQLGVAFEPLARGFRQLTAAATQAGLPLADQQRLLTALSIEARRVGASNEELGRAITAVSQIASKGKVSMEELRQQLGEAIPTAMAAAARGLGRTTEELEKLIETGSVRFPTFARALTRGFEELQQGSGALADGAQQAFNRLRNAFTAFKDALGKNVLPEMERLAGIAQSILETATKLLNISGGRMGGAVGPSIQDLGATSAQAQELARLQRLITMYEQQVGVSSPEMRTTREEMLARAKEQRDELLETIRLTQDQEVAQAKVTAEANKTAGTQQLTRDFVADLTKQMEALAKAQEDFRREASLAPALRGRPGGSLEEQALFQRGLQAATKTELEKLAQTVANVPAGVTVPAESIARLRELDQGYGRIGKALDEIKDKQQAIRKAESEAEQARKQAIRDEEQAAQQEVQRLRQVAQERQAAFEQLQRLASTYTTLKPVRDADTAAELAAALATSEHAAKAQEYADIIAVSAKIEAQIPTLRAQATASARAFEESRQAAAVDMAFDQRLQAAIEQQQATRAERPEARLRAQATREGLTLTPEQEGQLTRLTAVRQEQERLTEVVRIYNEAADAVGQSWTSALTSIADHTKTVSAAFRDMARSILQSLAQIAMQEGFRALTQLGARLIIGAALGGGTGSALGGAGSMPTPKLFASGGVVNRPTFSMLGESGPEAVVNRSQMAALMQFAQSATPSAGGQAAGGNVYVMNFPNREAAEQEAASQRALGHTAVMNAVLSDLSQGSGSMIHRAISTLSR